jgi:predicted nucleic acid-binding protein
VPVEQAWLRLLALPESVRVCVAAFGDIDSASEAVSAIIGAGILPTALEMMDAVIVAAALQAGCDTLWSEDMQHGMTLDEGLRIVNPFRA